MKSITKKQLETIFLQYANDAQSSQGSDVRAFAICQNCGYPLYHSPAKEYKDQVFHLSWHGFCFEPRWRKS